MKSIEHFTESIPHAFLHLWLPALLMLNCSSSLEEGYAQEPGEEIDLAGHELSSLETDYSRPYMYGLDPMDGSVFFINTDSQVVEKVVDVGSNPTDMTIDTQEDALYVVDFGSANITKMDLKTFSVLDTKSFPAPGNDPGGTHYDIQAGRSNLVYYLDVKSAPDVHLFDFESGTEIDSFSFDGIGDFVATRDRNEMYLWRQFGWIAGQLASWVTKVDTSTDNLVQIDRSNTSPEGRRTHWTHRYESMQEKISYFIKS